MNGIITAKDLCLWYGSVQALKNIDIAIPEQSITAFIGPSGCGKSTFLRAINRMSDLVPGAHVTGSLTFRGQEIYDPQLDVTALRRRIGMVFQKPTPFPMSIYDNVAYGPRTHGVRSRARLDELVEQSLRAAAIWHEGDEATSALDPISTARIEDLTLELRERYTIVMVTHNMQQAARISDKTAFFLMGELVEMGNTEQLFSMPRDKRTEDYITGRFG